MVALLWLILLVASPYVASHGKPGSALFSAAGTVYLAGRAVCHQRADRSFHAWGVQLPVCARCFGLYAGAVVGGIWGAMVAAVLGGRRWPQLGGDGASDSRWPAALAIAALPTCASIGLEIVGVWAQSPAVRCVAALPLGFLAAWFVAVHAAEAFERISGVVRVKRAGL